MESNDLPSKPLALKSSWPLRQPPKFGISECISTSCNISGLEIEADVGQGSQAFEDLGAFDSRGHLAFVA